MRVCVLNIFERVSHLGKDVADPSQLKCCHICQVPNSENALEASGGLGFPAVLEGNSKEKL